MCTCPYCDMPLDLCVLCGEPIPEDGFYCHKCKEGLVRKFLTFIPDEETYNEFWDYNCLGIYDMCLKNKFHKIAEAFRPDEWDIVIDIIDCLDYKELKRIFMSREELLEEFIDDYAQEIRDGLEECYPYEVGICYARAGTHHCDVLQEQPELATKYVEEHMLNDFEDFCNAYNFD